ncbi:MAG: triose-phosphate isomerase [Candidatus Heimdallarchaeota archaeon]
MRKYVIGGNCKMQVTTINKSLAIAKDLLQAIDILPANEKIDVFICPSFNALSAVSKVIKGTNLKLGAQNVHFQDSGAFTGEISIEALQECDVEYVLVGHSERRRIFNETNKDINFKLLKVLDSGLTAVLCIGESAEEFNKGKTQEINWQQLSHGLVNVSQKDLERVVIAYEPVWAINNKYLNPTTKIRAATPSEARISHKMVRKWFIENYSEIAASKIRIQYGGSMNKRNCADLFSIEDIDGGLIGGASLSKEKFLPILKTATENR